MYLRSMRMTNFITIKNEMPRAIYTRITLTSSSCIVAYFLRAPKRPDTPDRARPGRGPTVAGPPSRHGPEPVGRQVRGSSPE